MLVLIDSRSVNDRTKRREYGERPSQRWFMQKMRVTVGMGDKTKVRRFLHGKPGGEYRGITN